MSIGKSLVAWFSQRRKFVVALVTPWLYVASHYLGGPAHVPATGMWYVLLVGELAALGVHAVANDASSADRPITQGP